MPFHRFQDPSYNLLGGTFPGTIGTQSYDRVNVVTGGVGGGDGSANADGAKAAGPNAGTYFVAFGEDATSSFTNRGMRALAQNTDALDSVLRGSIPYVERVVYDPLSSSVDITITGDVFVGESGMPNTQANRDKLFHIENSDSSPLAALGVDAVCTLIHNGSGTNVLGTTTDGFRNGATFRLNQQVSPGGIDGVGYVVLVGRRTSYANLLETKISELVSEHIRGRAFDINLSKHFSHGLDSKYRKSSIKDGASSEYDTPGVGGYITRDGRALTVELSTHDWEGSPAATDDPIRAGFAAVPIRFWPEGHGGTAYDADHSGNIGYAHVTLRRQLGTGLETGTVSRDAASYITLNAVDLSGPGLFYTYLSASTPALLNPSGSGASRVRVSSPYYLRSSGNTGIAIGYDLLLITRVDGSVTTTKPYVITGFVDDSTATVAPLGGAAGAAASFTTNTAATVRWVQPSEIVGGLYGDASWKALSIIDTGRNLSASPSAGYGVAEILCQQGTQSVFAVRSFAPTTGLYANRFLVKGNGSVEQVQGVSSISLALRATEQTITTTLTYQIDQLIGHSSVYFVEGGAGSKTLTLVDIGYDGAPTPGFEFVFYINNSLGSSITLVTPPSWRFSDPNDAIIPTTASRTYKFVVHYSTKYTGGRYIAYVTRTDYVD